MQSKVSQYLCFICPLFQALVAEQESKDSGGASIAEQVLSIMEIILDEANAEISEDKVMYHIPLPEGRRP